MKISNSSFQTICDAVLKAVAPYRNDDVDHAAITDFHFQAKPDSGDLLILDDDDNVLASCTVEEWANTDDPRFEQDLKRTLKQAIAEANKDDSLDNLNVLRPYSFVLVDDDMETVAELHLVDDNTLMLNEELMKGLDDDLNQFLEQLMKEE